MISAAAKLAGLDLLEVGRCARGVISEFDRDMVDDQGSALVEHEMTDLVCDREPTSGRRVLGIHSDHGLLWISIEHP